LMKLFFFLFKRKQSNVNVLITTPFEECTDQPKT
jgi:hypothetical protein